MEARLPPRRLLTYAAALVLLVVLTSGCGGGSGAHAAAKDPAPTRYTDRVLSFTHPAAWKATPFRWPGELHFHPLVYLSTQPLHDPCTTQNGTTTCGFPVQSLEPGGVLAVWQFVETPVVSPVKLAGEPLRVDGRPAGRSETADGTCRSIGADRTIDVTAEVNEQSLISLTACLRGPGLGHAEAEVKALLASTKFHAAQ